MSKLDVMRRRGLRSLGWRMRPKSADYCVDTCVTAQEQDVLAYDETEVCLSFRQARRYLSRNAVHSFNRRLSLYRDQYVSYGRGIYCGMACVVVHHSHIHHFFVDPQDKTRYTV